MYADVIVDITHEKLDKVFQYRIPSNLEGMLEIGMAVWIPFGRGNRETLGYVVGFSQACEIEESRIKPLLRIATDNVAIEGKLMALAAWMKEHYGGTMIQALKTVLPVKKQERQKENRTVCLLLSKEDGEKKLAFFLEKNQRARARLLAALLDEPRQSYEILTKTMHVTKTVIDALEDQGVLKVESEQVYREAISQTIIGVAQKDASKDGQKDNQKDNPQDTGLDSDGMQVGSRQPKSLNDEQQLAVDTFVQDFDDQNYQTYLLRGVTGSGKTEVYIQMIEHIVKEGRQAIVMIPEIALTYQTVLRFYQRFGDRVSIINSRLSQGARFDQMERAKRGDVDVMIGPRSALFTPFSNLGLIVIDEEHETSYKSEQIPRYHARETAVKRAQMEGASVVLGSATPSLESFYRCQTGEYRLLELTKRVQERELPQVYVEDMREELKEGNRSVFSRKLRELIADRLEKKQQLMLFLNRRGYAGFISCRACGYTAKCPHCDVALSAHRGGKLVCHYCGYEEKLPEKCPECGSTHIGGFRAGTQQIESLLLKEFPQAKILRMDTDTTRGKDGYEKILSTFSSGEADVLIGTQMIVKGHDFPNVTLVGVLAADLSLYADNYLAAERTFQLLMQAAGRAGRGKIPGEVVIQTYSPEHYSIQAAANQDFEQFYEEEIQYRDLMGYPPVEQMLEVIVQSSDEPLLEMATHYLREYMDKLVGRTQKVQIIGPTAPFVGKVNDIYRRVLYLKCEKYDILIHIKNKCEQYTQMNTGFANVRVQFDFNPMSLM